MKFLIPQGIGDCIWALTKVQDIAQKLGDGIVDLYVNHTDTDYRESRAMPFLERFSFVRKVGKVPVPILLPGPPADENGYFRYLPDGERLGKIDYALMPNAPMERGIRLENWLPQFETNWNIFDDFQFRLGELRYVNEHCSGSQTAVLFLGAEDGNTVAGHNRGGIWKPTDWILLGQAFEQMGLRVIVVGASYDRSYFEKFIKSSVKWDDMIGSLSIGKTMAMLNRARFVVSYQSGIGIAASYLGTRTAMFWRAKGDSIIPDVYVSFEESMAEAWVPPAMLKSNKYLPLIYGREDSGTVFQKIIERGW